MLLFHALLHPMVTPHCSNMHTSQLYSDTVTQIVFERSHERVNKLLLSSDSSRTVSLASVWLLLGIFNSLSFKLDAILYSRSPARDPCLLRPYAIDCWFDNRVKILGLIIDGLVPIAESIALVYFC